MFYADRQTKMTKLIVALRCFEKKKKNALYEGRAGKTECELVDQSSLFNTEDFRYIFNLICSSDLQSYRSTIT
jgi:hypothetical protein